MKNDYIRVVFLYSLLTSSKFPHYTAKTNLLEGCREDSEGRILAL